MNRTINFHRGRMGFQAQDVSRQTGVVTSVQYVGNRHVQIANHVSYTTKQQHITKTTLHKCIVFQ